MLYKTPNAPQNCDTLINSFIYVHDDNYINIMHRRSHISIIIIASLQLTEGNPSYRSVIICPMPI